MALAEKGNVTPIKLPLPQRWFGSAAALVADQQGRLVAASGRDLFIYNPRDHTVISRSVPISDASAIVALAPSNNGLIYGGVNQGYSGGSRLFAYDPTAGAFEDLGMPLSSGNRIYSLAAAPDGRIYGGGGIWRYDSHGPIPNLATYILFVYDPIKRTSSSLGSLVNDARQIRALLVVPDGTLYFGTGLQFWSGGSFYRYDPLTDQWTELSLPVRGDVIALTLGSNGLIYGSVAQINGDGYVFTYDPQQPAQPPQLIGASLKTGVTAFLAGPDDLMYAAVGGYNSVYRGPAALLAFRTTCPYGTIGDWKRLTYQTITPLHTHISIDVLDSKDNLLLADVKNGGSLNAIDAQKYPAIKLRATLATDDPSVTPILGDWRVIYDFHCVTNPPSPIPTVASHSSTPTDIFSIFSHRIAICLSNNPDLAFIWRCLSQ